MLDIKKQIFNAAMAGLLIAAPALAADNGTAYGADGGEGRTLAAQKLECSGANHEHRGRRMGFSDSQLESMSSMKNQFLDKTSGERVELGTLHRQLRDVLSQTQIDRSKAVELQSRINSIKADISNARLNLKMDEIAVLTPQQREQLHHRMLVAEAFGGRFQHRHSSGGHFEHGGSRQAKA